MTDVTRASYSAQALPKGHGHMEVVYALVIAAAFIALLLLLRKRSEPVRRTPQEGQPADEASAASAEVPMPEPEEAASAEPVPGMGVAPAPELTEPERVSAEIDVGARPSLRHVPDVGGLRQGLAKSRSESGFFGRLRALLVGKREMSPELATEIEEVLLSSDVGVKTTGRILDAIRGDLPGGDLADETKVWAALRSEATAILSAGGESGAFPLTKKPTVVLLVGVNGSGKTTTIGKLATRLTAEGRSCVLAAGDTFRAAAVQQLVIWGERVGVEVVRGKDGADPGSVVFDAIQRANEHGADVVLADTAGRLHTKSNLMAELKKVARTAEKAMPGAPHEVLLVLDATNGQNALAQASEFAEALPVTGLVLTKLDGTAKGGMVLGVCDTLGLPVRFIGLGERAEDLRDFVPAEFVEALLGREAEPS